MRITSENLKIPLGLIVKNRRGYQSKLEKYSEFLDSFKTIGFINTGHTLKHETYSTTKLADSYYRDIYGNFAYLTQRLKGLFKTRGK